VVDVADGSVDVPGPGEARVPPAVAVGVERDAESVEARVVRLRDPVWRGDVGAVEALRVAGVG